MKESQLFSFIDFVNGVDSYGECHTLGVKASLLDDSSIPNRGLRASDDSTEVLGGFFHFSGFHGYGHPEGILFPGSSSEGSSVSKIIDSSEEIFRVDKESRGTICPKQLFDGKNWGGINIGEIEIVKSGVFSSFSSQKPPYSYATLIKKALSESREGKLTLSQIYKWIKVNFPYYKTADPAWQNSIRHNLSLNKNFVKVKRPSNDPGKGGFWKINTEHVKEQGERKVRRWREEKEN